MGELLANWTAYWCTWMHFVHAYTRYTFFIVFFIDFETCSRLIHENRIIFLADFNNT